MPSHHPDARGFFLVELLAVLAVLAIVATLGIPALETWAARWQLQAAVDTLGRGLALARSEAMATGGPVAFRAGGLPGALRWRDGPPTIRFGATGGATPGTLTVCAPTQEGQSLVVSRTGRVRVTGVDCGFALVEILAGLLVVSLAGLGVLKTLLAGTFAVNTQERFLAMLDASAAGTELLRSLEGDAGLPPEALLGRWTDSFGTTAPGRAALDVQVLGEPGRPWRVVSAHGNSSLEWQVER